MINVLATVLVGTDEDEEEDPDVPVLPPEADLLELHADSPSARIAPKAPIARVLRFMFTP
jgi:hypothetical protein